jgi:hypothetical protein
VIRQVTTCDNCGKEINEDTCGKTEGGVPTREIEGVWVLGFKHAADAIVTIDANMPIFQSKEDAQRNAHGEYQPLQFTFEKQRP